ncbi:Calpain-type cysteine protease DEK1 (Phytocalpain DEK1) (Protein DEFECTIVE KERNEL 1) (AtDEK1) (Protein EMBRYO DEFECTIVE 1275) (Protein EMBRYO DEFECTIVE 80) [Durusdinium trenchii]|uniref:Calpain-type cysteine protease DEK1 (Phytocalpain DEK1) (Protein DEFECTIVE KERNEL 1) (AtDEK1) (Protein EMBRYO DEFECTIVE 1275) (Protein EMBRYO DEFECTIVE 80) n=1 Tax=Durusdinium trenchii TaxID=1381693 RepID=A0ABP0PU60_9DINO
MDVSQWRCLLTCEDETQDAIDQLQTAIDQATVAGLEGDLIDRANARIQEIKDILAKLKDDEKKRREEERRRQAKGGNFEDKAWKPKDYGSKAHDPQYKPFGSVWIRGRIEKLREMKYVENVQLFEDGCHPSDIHQGAALAEFDKFTYKDEGVGLYVVRFYKNGVYRDRSLKAYAKLHGSYDSIEGGYVNDGLVDLTGGSGGIHDGWNRRKEEINDGTMWATLKGLARDGHLLGLRTRMLREEGSIPTPAMQVMGKGHAYSLLRVEEVDGHRLVQLRNPWGNTEWRGKWSDGDEESWTQKMTKKLGHTSADDGTFWMAFEDFVLHYRCVYICRVFDKEWNKKMVSSEWRGETAGEDLAARAKQDAIFGDLWTKSRGLLFLTLLQHDARGVGEGDNEVPIGFGVFKDTNLYDRVCDSGTYCYDREVFVDTELTETGSSPYLIVPTTFKAGQERAFTMSLGETTSVVDPVGFAWSDGKAYWKGDDNAVEMYMD